MNRRGFTALELLLVMIIGAAVSAVAVPKYADLKRLSLASELLADVEAVRAATYSFYSDSGYFPPEVAGGIIPTNLERYLPAKFAFKTANWQMDYEHWSLKNTPARSKSPVLIGVTVTTKEPKVGLSAIAMYGNSPKFVLGRKNTFIIVGM